MEEKEEREKGRKEGSEKLEEWQRKGRRIITGSQLLDYKDKCLDKEIIVLLVPL